MRKFGLRLWLVRVILDSLIWDCMDEYDDFDAISGGVAHLHYEIVEWEKNGRKPTDGIEE